MKRMKKLATSKDINIKVVPPFNPEVLQQRNIDYATLSDIKFGKKYRSYLYAPAYLEKDDNRIEIQFNKCSNPFCGRYGQSQKKYENIKSKPSRYKIGNNPSGNRVPLIVCNTIQGEECTDAVINHTTTTLSNWSIAEEIKRLIRINRVVPIEIDYKFHKCDCENKESTPFTNSKDFYKRGKSTSNSQKYQCKKCKKITNILPSQEKSFNYHQQRNELLLDMLKDILSRTPVKRTCEKLDMSPDTYYRKLECLYRKCLEFLERYESEKFSQIIFNDMWINTDTLAYNLNNVKLKGKGGKKSLGQLDKKLITSIIASCDMNSGYILRNYVAYDYDISMNKIEEDTLKFHCDHSPSYLRKYERLRYSYAPQPPTEFDTQSEGEYNKKLIDFNIRKNYVEGVHVKATYTAIAHYFLIDKMLNINNNLRFVSDDDPTLQLAIHKVFTDKFLENKAIYFTCQADKTLTLDEAGRRSIEHRKQLNSWGKSSFPDLSGLENFAIMKILDMLESHDFFDYRIINNKEYPYKAKKPIKHPLPTKDEGELYINVISPIKNMANEELANLIFRANNRSIDRYFQSIRRRLSILERPLVTSRGDGKSYIYANYNPKYAQYVLTIFRTIYNFCFIQGGSKDEKQTPAMKLGIANKVYELKDIIYFR